MLGTDCSRFCGLAAGKGTESVVKPGQLPVDGCEFAREPTVIAHCCQHATSVSLNDDGAVVHRVNDNIVGFVLERLHAVEPTSELFNLSLRDAEILFGLFRVLCL